jgi:serine/threonine protein phosphatase PrpC
MLIDDSNRVEVIAKSKGFLFLKGTEPEVFSGKINAKGKHVAMCSDGLYDQIGGVTNRRLRLSGMIQWIEEGDVFNAYQCHIDELFVKWKGSQDQTDDAPWVRFKL